MRASSAFPAFNVWQGENDLVSVLLVRTECRGSARSTKVSSCYDELVAYETDSHRMIINLKYSEGAPAVLLDFMANFRGQFAAGSRKHRYC